MQASGISQSSSPALVARASQVIERTGTAWRIPPASAQEIARRMPVGYVPIRVRRRRQQAGVRAYGKPLLAHSW